jgi:phage/plasmid-associated DNA primase
LLTREDAKLTGKLMMELPGILNWAAAGWAGLEQRGHFQQPESATEAVEQLEDLSSPIGAFGVVLLRLRVTEESHYTMTR